MEMQLDRGIFGNLDVYLGGGHIEMSYIPFTDYATEVGTFEFHSMDHKQMWENLSITMHFNSIDDIDKVIGCLEDFRADILSAKQKRILDKENYDPLDYLCTERFI